MAIGEDDRFIPIILSSIIYCYPTVRFNVVVLLVYHIAFIRLACLLKIVNNIALLFYSYCGLVGNKLENLCKSSCSTIVLYLPSL